jgi:hypothetical protein
MIGTNYTTMKLFSIIIPTCEKGHVCVNPHTINKPYHTSLIREPSFRPIHAAQMQPGSPFYGKHRKVVRIANVKGYERHIRLLLRFPFNKHLKGNNPLRIPLGGGIETFAPYSAFIIGKIAIPMV